MSPVLRVVVTLALVLGTAACTGRRAPAPSRDVVIAPGLTFTLPPPGDLGRRVEASQLITARYGEHTFVFECQLSAAPDRFLLVAIDPLGRRALTVTWTSSGVTVEAASWLPRQVRAEHMLADIVILYWPEPIVRAALARSGGSLVSEPQSRSVLAGGKEVLRAEYEPSQDGAWSGHLRYRNDARGYELDIRSTEAVP